MRERGFENEREVILVINDNGLKPCVQNPYLTLDSEKKAAIFFFLTKISPKKVVSFIIIIIIITKYSKDFFFWAEKYIKS